MTHRLLRITHRGTLEGRAELEAKIDALEASGPTLADVFATANLRSGPRCECGRIRTNGVECPCGNGVLDLGEVEF